MATGAASKMSVVEYRKEVQLEEPLKYPIEVYSVLAIDNGDLCEAEFLGSRDKEHAEMWAALMKSLGYETSISMKVIQSETC